MSSKAKRKIYDSVFTSFFSDAENQLRLYKDLHPEDTDVTVDDITDVTLAPTFTDQLYNDLGFTIKDRTILLVEAQSTWCPNMALRALMYLAETFREYTLNTKQSYYDSSRVVRLPKPELYVLYTGETGHAEEVLSMADTFWGGDARFLDLKVKVLYGDDTEAVLSQYTEFTRIYRKYKALYGPTEEAVLKAIEECIQKNVLKEYLESKKTEVVDIMMALFDRDLIQEMHDNSIQERSREEGVFESVDKLVAEGTFTAEKACEILGVDYSKYLNRK